MMRYCLVVDCEAIELEVRGIHSFACMLVLVVEDYQLQGNNDLLFNNLYKF